jgi:hypothetical protein
VFWAAAALALTTSLVAWFFLNQQKMLPTPGQGGTSRPSSVSHRRSPNKGPHQRLS